MVSLFLSDQVASPSCMHPNHDAIYHDVMQPKVPHYGCPNDSPMLLDLTVRNFFIKYPASGILL